MAGDLVRVDPVRGRRGLEALQHAHPVLAARLRRTLQVERQVDVDQPRGVLGALQVAAHPIEVIGDSRKHATFYPSLVQHPGILAAAPLRRVDHQRAAAQRHAGQAAGHDRDLLAVEDEGPQIHVPGFELVADEAGRA